MRAVMVRVTGRVQGVGFRWHTVGRARELGVVGWVRNEPDGSVTTHVEGSDEAVSAMIDWLRVGPPAGRVDEVEVEDVPIEGFEGFVATR